ncbi:MAG TPA: Ldh family oxidoreductase [Devosia sp.]|nr:Ldh family oxidoreductase [Devosia sp.]
MSSTVLPAEAVHNLIAGALERSDTSAANAAAVARALVAAELAGQTGHGLRRVAAYAAQAASGKVAGHVVPTVSQHRPGAIAVNANDGFAYPALEAAFAPLSAAARTQGIAAAGIRRSHHCGVAGVTVEAYAAAGLIALMFANSPGAMAPWGGRQALFGTNPIAFAAPVPDGEPIVVDVSLSKVARGKIMAAAQKGESIPEGWAFDAEGRPTTDPKAALAGTMAALGDAKGSALALMVELLAAGLTGAHFASEASSFFDAEGAPPGVGQLIIAIDPALFGAGNVVARFGHMAEAIAGMDGARVPGRRRQALRREMLAHGIPVDDQLRQEIEKIGR